VTDLLTPAAAAGRAEPAGDATAAARGATLPGWREALKAGQPLWIRIHAGDGPTLLAPVVVDARAAGLFVVRLSRPPRDAREEADLAGILARELALFFQLEQLAQSQRQAAVLEERNRMAREIHDSLAQGFTGIVVQLNAVEEAIGSQPDL